MNNKKYIKFGIAFCSIIVIILLLSFLSLLLFSHNKQPAETDEITSSSEENLSSDDENIELKIEREIEVDEDTLKNIIEKINFPTYAIASLYNTKSFNLNSYPNDLILRLGWSKINISDESVSLYQNDNDVSQTQTVPKNTLYQKIYKIFGNNIQYEDSSFINDNVETFNNIIDNPGTINYSNDLYIASYIEDSGGTTPFIHQEIDKVTKTDNLVKLYVKTAFINPEYSDELMGYNYDIYKDFDFENNSFENLVTTVADNSFFEFSTENDYPGIISLNPNQEIYEISDILNTYVYTFEYDEGNHEYYLTAFSIDK